MAEEPKHAKQSKDYTGHCLCGDICYKAKAVRPVWCCHCEQCRRITGHYMAAAQVDLSDIEITGKPKWFYVSEKSRFGSCQRCGTTIFWRNENNPYLSITAGTLDDSQDLQIDAHVFTAEKGGYYDIDHDNTFTRFWPEGTL